MIQIVWQYEVKETFRAKFELAYGPGGAWSQLFGASPGYRGTVLLRDTHHPRRYLSIDSWDAEDQYEAFLKEHSNEYSSLDATFQEWTDAETKVGIYKLLAEATVRPRPGAGRAGARPRSRRGGA
jgi:heme-degrading monooxygenase HmoA